MAYDILQSSTQSPLLFFMTDSTDHITGKTGLTPTVTISKAGGSFASPSGAVTEIGNGWYKVAGNATDTATLGPLILHATGTGADPCDIIIANVVAYNPQDSVRIGITALPNAAAGANTGLPVVGTQVPNATAGASGGLLISGSNSGTTTFGALTVTGATTLTGDVSLGSTLSTTGTVTFNAFTVTNALTVSGTTTLTGAVTATNGSNNITGVTASLTGDLTATMKTSVTTACTASTPTAAAVTGNVGGNVTGSVGSVASGGIARASFAADTGLQTIRSGTCQAGSTGTTIVLDASASATNDFYNFCGVFLTGGTGAGQFREVLDYVGSTTTATVRTWTTTPDNTTTFAILPRYSVWDSVTADHLTSGSTGAALNAAGSAGDPWSTSLPGVYGAGTAGFILGTNLDTTVSSRSTLTQTQVTGGAYSVQSSSCVLGDARIANLDATVSSRLAPTTAGRTLDVTATGGAGIDWSNVENPTTTLNLSGTTIKAVTDPVSGGTDLTSILGTAITEGAAGRLAGAFSTLLNVASPVFTVASVNQTGDSFARIGATGSGLTSLAPASTALSTATWTGALATSLTTLASHDPGTTLASTTNITAGTITTATNVTTLNGIAAGVITDTAFATSGANRIADTTRRRSQANVEASSYGDALTLLSHYGFIQQAQESNTTATPGFLTVYKTDGTTVLGTRTITTDVAAEPITGVE